MKKKLLSFLLTALLLTVPAFAAENSSENFVRSKTYDNQFSDLSADSAFYENVSALYEYGLSVGKTDGSYGVKDSLTVGQAVIFAGRIRSLYRTGDPEAGPAAFAEEGAPTALRYLRYLQSEEVLGTELDELLPTTASRAQTAHILARILPEEELPLVNDELITEGYATHRLIQDVTEYTPYFRDILFLYRCGICIGSDAYGTFYPDSPITRGAVAAMLTRLIDPELRLTLKWAEPEIPDVSDLTLADLVVPGTYIAAPSTPEEMDESIRHMLSSGSNTLTLHYPDTTFVGARDVMHNAMSVLKSYCEQSYNYVSCTFTSDGDVTLTFAATGAEHDIETYRTAAMEAAITVHDQLWAEGLLHDQMSEMDKARLYYAWICENCEYDHNAGDDSLSHIPYNLFQSGLAVCDGYTGAYNLLLKLEGIACRGYYTENHMWTIATLDGVEYHIDTTWGDAGDAAYAQFFAMTPEQSELYHRE